MSDERSSRDHRKLLEEAARARVSVPLPIPIQIGAGDVIAKVTKALGLKECEGCAKRRAALNRALSFGPKPQDPAT